MVAPKEKQSLFLSWRNFFLYFSGSFIVNSSQNIMRVYLDNAATTGSYDISYQINGGTIVTESSAVSIQAGGTVNYTFASTANLAATGNYTVRVFVKQTGDTQTANDELTYTVKHVANPAVVLHFAESFEAIKPWIANEFGYEIYDNRTPRIASGKFRPAGLSPTLQTSANACPDAISIRTRKSPSRITA